MKRAITSLGKGRGFGRCSQPLIGREAETDTSICVTFTQNLLRLFPSLITEDFIDTIMNLYHYKRERNAGMGQNYAFIQKQT